MSSNAQDQLHDSAAAYALDALAPEERRAFEEHLRTCEACRAEVAELSEAASALAYTTDATRPPARLRNSILEAARSEPPNVLPLRPRWTTPWIAAVAAAAAIAVGVGLWATIGTDGPGRPAQRVALQGANGTLSVASSGHAFMSLGGIAPAPAGKTYEIWVIADGKPQPAGLFEHGGTVSLAREVPRGATVAVTLERAGGVKQPTGKILFQARVAA